MKIYTVTATRSDGWWVINADVTGAIVWTQARRLEQVEPMAREAIALTLDVPQDSFGLNVLTHVPEGVQVHVDTAKQLAQLSEELQSLTAHLRRKIAVYLRDSGFTVRDSGELLGVSSQRVSQLLTESKDDHSSSNISDLITDITNQLAPAQDLMERVARSGADSAAADRG
jgi:predicted transcriptional regulator/predicted RNase H-like HicB family nuclease